MFSIIKSLIQEEPVHNDLTNDNMMLISKKHCKKLLEMDPHTLIPTNKVKLPKLKLRQQSKLPNIIKRSEDCKHTKLTLPPLRLMKKEHKSKIPVTKCFGKASNKKYLPAFPEIVFPR